MNGFPLAFTPRTMDEPWERTPWRANRPSPMRTRRSLPLWLRTRPAREPVRDEPRVEKVLERVGLAG